MVILSSDIFVPSNAGEVGRHLRDAALSPAGPSARAPKLFSLFFLILCQDSLLVGAQETERGVSTRYARTHYVFRLGTQARRASRSERLSVGTSCTRTPTSRVPPHTSLRSPRLLAHTKKDAMRSRSFCATFADGCSSPRPVLTSSCTWHPRPRWRGPGRRTRPRQRPASS